MKDEILNLLKEQIEYYENEDFDSFDLNLLDRIIQEGFSALFGKGIIDHNWYYLNDRIEKESEIIYSTAREILENELESMVSQHPSNDYEYLQNISGIDEFLHSFIWEPINGLFTPVFWYNLRFVSHNLIKKIENLEPAIKSLEYKKIVDKIYESVLLIQKLTPYQYPEKRQLNLRTLMDLEDQKQYFVNKASDYLDTYYNNAFTPLIEPLVPLLWKKEHLDKMPIIFDALKGYMIPEETDYTIWTKIFTGEEIKPEERICWLDDSQSKKRKGIVSLRYFIRFLSDNKYISFIPKGEKFPQNKIRRCFIDYNSKDIGRMSNKFDTPKLLEFKKYLIEIAPPKA